MRYAYYPGCVSQGGAPELFKATQLVGERLGLTLEHLKEASCTGSGVLQERDPELGDTLNARTFAMAEKRGLPIMTICSTCQGVMSQANHKLKQDADYLAFINQYLKPEGLEYKGTTEVKHFMWILVEDYGLDRLESLVRRPLTGVAIAPFYGCYVLRPTEKLGYDEHPERDTYLEKIITTLGGAPIDFWGKTKCCGFPILMMNRQNSPQHGGGPSPGGQGQRGRRDGHPLPPLPPEPGRPAAGRRQGQEDPDRPAGDPPAPDDRDGPGPGAQGLGPQPPPCLHRQLRSEGACVELRSLPSPQSSPRGRGGARPSGSLPFTKLSF